MIASFGMALRYSFNMGKEADLIDHAAQRRSPRFAADIKSEAETGAAEMGAAIIGELERLTT